MRWVICGLVAGGLVQPALAGDYDPLRGSMRLEPGRPTYFRWDGFYAGAFAGVSASATSFGSVTTPLIADILRQTELESSFHPSTWPKLSSDYNSRTFIGGYFGYNAQWDDAVIGLEADFTKMNLFADLSDSISRTLRLSDNYLYDVTVSAQANVELLELGTVRARFGWAFGQFLPFMTAGVAFGRVNYMRSATVDYPVPTYGLAPPTPPEQPPPPATTCSGAPPSCFSQSKIETRNNVVALGFAGGVGTDVALTSHFFVRGEYQIAVLPVAGMQILLHNFRVGAGFKF